MKRSPLKRKTRIKPRSTTKKTRPRNVPYMLWVKTLPCAAGYMDGHLCSGPIHAHRAGERPGIGMKAPDETCIPLCEHHHQAWHAAHRPFEALHHHQRRAWSDRIIAETRAKRGVA